MKVNAFQRCLALLLCLAMLLPNFSSLAFRAKAAVETPLATETEDKWTPASDPFASGEIPVFTTSGSVSQTLENDCGNGLTGDGAKSYLRIVTGATASETTYFWLDLTAAGFTRVTSQILPGKVGNNTFARFLSPKKDYVLTVYYIEGYGETHLIVDTAEDIVKDFAGGFMYQSTTGEVAQTMMVLYGLSMSPNGYDINTETSYGTGARNCGAMTVIRMPDNSLFINDGGDIQQWSNEACADFMQFCRELTGKEEGEKVVINTWFISHAHSDHFEGIPRFFDLYHDHIDIKNVMYNIDDECLTSTRDMSAVMQMVHGYFPDAKYYKPHTGEHFNIAGVEFNVLYTQEDRFEPAADGSLSCGNVLSKSREGGTYRECLVDSVKDGVNLYDFNDTSTVLKVTFPTELTNTEREVTSILYADANHAEEIIMNMWPDSVLETDIMMVPHHGHDAHPELVAKSGASIFLYTQAKSAIYGANGVVEWEKVTADDGTVTYKDASEELPGSYRSALVNYFLAMHDPEGEKYFDTTDTRKTYWEGTETACILFGEDTAFQNMPTGLERDSEDPSGFTVYTMDAPFFEYTGWQIIGTVKGSNPTTTGAVTTDTNNIRFLGVTASDGLEAGQLYTIVHDKTDQVMIYDALKYVKDKTDQPAIAGSLHVGTRDEVDAGTEQAYYYINTNTLVSDDRNIYFDHSYRDLALWEYKTTQINGDAFKTAPGYEASFGGTLFYKQSLFLKGTDADTDHPFWHIPDAEATGYFRVLQPNDVNIARLATIGEESNVQYNIRIEFFKVPNKAADDPEADPDEDGVNERCDTCLIYYASYTEAKGSYNFRFLTVDEAGNWCMKMYDTLKEATDNLDDLKLRLYRYNEVGTDYKQVSMTGSSRYEVIDGTSSADLAAYIANSLTVNDTSRHGLDIPCSGTAPMDGHYWLDLSAYEALTDGQTTCAVTVNYHNDNGTDTEIGKVTVVLVDSFNMYTDYNDDDTVYAGTQYGSRYGFMYLGTTTIYEEVKNHTNLMDMTVNKLTLDSNGETVVVSETVRITPDMLTRADGAAVDFSNAGVYTGLNLNYAGEVVGTGFALRVAENTASLQYPAAGEEGHIEAGKGSLTSPEDFLSTGVANIQLSASGIPVDKGIDLIIVMDLSGSMRNGVDTNKTATEDTVSRMEAMENALQEIIGELRTSGADIRIAMSDFGDLDHFVFEDAVSVQSIRDQAFYESNHNNTLNHTYEFYNQLNFVISRDEDGVVDFGAGPFGIIDKKFNPAHCSYTGAVIPTVYTGSGVVNAGAFVDVDALTDTVMEGIVAKLEQNVTQSLGTNYDIGLEYAYQLGHAITKHNETAGEDRELVCIFMSDGAAMQYNYFSGNNDSDGWSDWLLGEIDDVESVADVYADPSNWPSAADADLNYVDQLSKAMLDLLMAETVNEDYGDTHYSQLQTPEYRSRGTREYFRYYPAKTRATAYYFFTYMDDQGFQLDWPFLERLALANGYESFTVEDYRNDPVLQNLVDKLTTPSGDIVYKKDENGEILYETDEDGNFVLDENNEKIPVIDYFPSSLRNPDYRDKGIVRNQTDSDRIPVSQYRFYRQYTGTADESLSYTERFFAAMESLGYEMNWDVYTKIAFANRSALDAIFDPGDPDDAATTIQRAMIQAFKTPVGTENGVWQTLSPYDYFYNTEGKSWWAEAMKGDKDKLYPVVNKYAHQDNAGWTNGYYGTVRNYFSTGTGLELDGQDYISGFEGLDMELYTISFSIADDTKLTADTAEQVLKNIAGGPNYFFAANSEDGLITALKSIINSMNIAGTSAFYTDTMGESFDLATEQTIVNDDGTVLTLNAAPTIKVIEYVLDADGNRTGAFTVRETVTFEDLDGDGDVDAWSDQLYRTSIGAGGAIIKEKVDIWNEDTGLITAKYFYYNANTDKPVSIAFGAQGSYNLPAETFFWVIGTIGKTEMVLDYQVYLTGSFDEVKRWEGEYATNASATLLYTNYLGMPYSSDSPASPTHSWGQGKVGYGYYLVNKDGKPITADEAVTDFAGALKLTDAIYSDLEWNHAVSISGASGFSAVPAGYELFAPDVAYDLKADSAGTGYWSVRSDPQMTTYVQYVSGTTTEQEANGFTDGEYFDTVVWFAVKVAEGELSVNKTVEETGDHFTLTLDAFANGVTSQVSAVKPADIVLVLDQSASMYSPAGMAADRLYADKDHPDNVAIPDSARIENFSTKVAQGDATVLSNAKHLGYYIAVHNTLDYLYIVQYVEGSGWYYVPVNVTSRAVTVDTANATNDGALALFDAGTTGNLDSNGNPIYFLNAECQVPNTNLRDEFGTYTQMNHAILPDSLVTYYQTQYGALYDSVHDFITSLNAQALADDVDHRVAVVGFSSPYYENRNHYDGTGLYIDGQYHHYADGIGGLYGSAFADISTADGLSSIRASVNAITTNYLQTCPAIGIRIARSIFRGEEIALNDLGKADASTTAEMLIQAADPSGSAPEDRDQIIILFTDGVPTVSMYSEHADAYADTETLNEYWTPNAGVRDAINEANAAKREGVKIYTIGTAAASHKYGNTGDAAAANTPEGDNRVDFLDLVSSNYPSSSSVYDVSTGASGTTYNFTVDYGTQTGSDYVLSVTEGDELNVAFGTIMESITEPKVNLDSSDVLKEVLSDYFDLVGGSNADIQVYTAPFNADGTLGTPVLFEDAVVEIGKTDANSDRYDLITVSGYDYTAEYYSKYPRMQNGELYYGSKLIVKVPVQVREGFWGGNNVPTNEDTTAVYDVTYSGSEVIGEQMVAAFPVPHVNVDVQPVFQAKDHTIYYGETSIDGMDLLDGTITVDGITVTVDSEEGLKPAEDWMDDYATLTWADGSATEKTPISGTASSDNEFSLVLTPNDSTEADVGTAMPTGGNTVSDVSSVQVLVPILTFRDSMILRGKYTDSAYYNETNYLGNDYIKWVDMDKPYDTNGKSTDDLSGDVTLGDKPALTLSYTPEGGFNADTAVDVTVYLDGVEANEAAWFEWITCTSSLHDEAVISTHQANGEQAEFWIHVSSIEDDPNGLITDKYVTPVPGTNNQFLLTLEAYATGAVTQVTTTKPADIVLVIDHSASMHTPAGATKVLDNLSLYGEIGKTDKGQITKADLIPELAQHKGYYVAQSTSTKNWFIIQYEPEAAENQQWVCYNVTNTEKVVNKTEAEGWMEQAQTQHYSYESLPSQFVYYKSQYAMLYDSVLSFVQGLRESEVAHNVSIVGFAAYDNAGTRLYVGGDEAAYKSYKSALYHTNTTQERRNELYRKAMKNVAIDSEYEELLELIEAIDPNYGFTSPASGLQLANEVLAANPVDADARDQIVILFTDGIPNRAYGQGQYEETYTKDQILDQIVSIAATTKTTYGAQVYAISTSTTGESASDRQFLHYLSSDYPNATGYDSLGEEIAEPKYTMEVSSAGDLKDAFGSVTNQFTSSNVSMDKTTMLVEVLSEYFDFLAGGQQENGSFVDVRVYTQAYLGQGEWADKVLTNAVNIDLSSTTNDERLNKVAISGFDYAAEYVSDIARQVNGVDYYGSKLVVEVDIKTREGFWGGDNVATNDVTTGLYNPDSDIPVEIFPVPETNIPVDVQINIETFDKVIYYGSAPLDPADLLKVTAGGVDVLVTPEGFLPVEDWMDDYVTIDWTPDSGTTNFDTNISNVAEGKYPFSVTLTNKQSGQTTAATGESTVKILVPVYTFNDTTVPVGYTPDPNTENLVSGPIWVDLNTGVAGVASDPSTEPTLTLSYSVSGPISEDTSVQVTVNAVNPDGSEVDIMGAVTFKWVACQDGQNHDGGENVVTHLGSANSIEFTIHAADAIEDKVVIDFGLSVDIDPISNDGFAGVTLVGLFDEEPEQLEAPFDVNVPGDYGVLQIVGGKARYTLSGDNAMQMKTADTFWYVVAYNLGGKTVYDCGKLIVIPATTIYYEDSFIDFSIVENDTLNNVTNRVTEGGWTDVYTDENKTDFSDVVQSEDRPGEGLNDVDPNSIYGYDSAYTTMAQYSLGAAKMVNVFSRKDADGNVSSKTGRAEFVFSGTGFDVISLTSSTSGTIMVRLYQVDDEGNVSPTIYKTYVVDTYYGYVFDSQTGEWSVDPDAENTLYQVPVMKVEDLTYGTYKAVISASYNTFFDHDQYGNNSYDFYLDAIRIYDPAEGDEIAEGAHQDDGEGWPSYQELRDLLIGVGDFDVLGDTAQSGVIFIDGQSGINSVADYKNYGPNNELYLMPGQSVAFELNKETVANLAAVHLGVKSVGGTAKAEIYAVGQSGKLELTVNSATDLYYNITDLSGYTVVIRNSGNTAEGSTDAILSLTNIKTTFTAKPVEMRFSAFTLRRSSVNAVLASLAVEEQLPVLTPVAPSLAFKEEIMYNLFFSVENPSGLELEEMGMLTWSSEPEIITVDTAEKVMPGASLDSSYGWYKARSQGVPAKNMADTMYMAVYARLADGRYVYSDAVDYSAQEYAYNQLRAEGSSDALKSLCVALLNYGAAAQTYFGYRTDALMNAELTEEEQTLVSGYQAGSIADVLSVDSAKTQAFAATGGFSYMAPQASFKGAFSIKYLFAPAYAMDGEMTLYCWSEETYLANAELTADNADRVLTMEPDGSGRYVASYTGIAAKNMDDTVFVCGVYESNGVRYTTGVLAYSFGAYCRFGIRSGSGSFQALAEATSVYCQSAKTLFGVE